MSFFTQPIKRINDLVGTKLIGDVMGSCSLQPTSDNSHGLFQTIVIGSLVGVHPRKESGKNHKHGDIK